MYRRACSNCLVSASPHGLRLLHPFEVLVFLRMPGKTVSWKATVTLRWGLGHPPHIRMVPKRSMDKQARTKVSGPAQRRQRARQLRSISNRVERLGCLHRHPPCWKTDGQITCQDRGPSQKHFTSLLSLTLISHHFTAYTMCAQSIQCRRMPPVPSILKQGSHLGGHRSPA